MTAVLDVAVLGQELDWSVMDTYQSRPLRVDSERALVSLISRHLRRNWPVRGIGYEVSTHGRSRADLCVAMRDAEGAECFIAVEAKLDNWSRAIRQAGLNRRAVDISFVAVPIQVVNPSMVYAASSLGVGILGIGHSACVVSLGASLSAPDGTLRERVRSQLGRVRPRGALGVQTLVGGG